MEKTIVKPLYNNSVINLLLIFGWVAVNLYFYLTLGAVHAVDTPRYLLSAKEIIDTGKVNFSYNYWSSGYIFFIYLCLILDLTDQGIIFIQIIISGFAMACCIKSSEIIYNNAAGVATGLLYLVFLPIHSWNCYLLTESLFTSFTIISFYLTLKATSLKRFLLFSPVLIYSSLLRPVGFLILLSVLIYFLTVQYKVNKEKGIILLLALLVVIFPFTIILINKASETYTSIFISLYKSGDIIAAYKGLKALGTDSIKVADSSPSLLTLIQLICKNFLYSLQLFLLKLIFFLGHAKPYYSLIHNVFIVLTLYPLYFFSAKGLFNVKTVAAPKNFAKFFIASNALIVMISVEDWDGRYLFPLLPILFVFASEEINQFSKRLFLKILANYKMNSIK